MGLQHTTLSRMLNLATMVHEADRRQSSRKSFGGCEGLIGRDNGHDTLSSYDRGDRGDCAQRSQGHSS